MLAVSDDPGVTLYSTVQYGTRRRTKPAMPEQRGLRSDATESPKDGDQEQSERCRLTIEQLVPQVYTLGSSYRRYV